jgi:hypothetical protein
MTNARTLTLHIALGDAGRVVASLLIIRLTSP